MTTTVSAPSIRARPPRPTSTRPPRSCSPTPPLVKSAEAQVQIASLVQQTIQAAEDTVAQRQAQVEQAKANLAQAEVNLSYTELRAPQDGRITRRNVDLGTFVQAGQQVFYIVTPQVWVTANFKETQLADMRPGQHVSMDVDAYPQPAPARPCRQHPGGQRRPLLRLPGRKRHRQLRQDRPPRAGQDHHRQRPRQQRRPCRSAFPSPPRSPSDERRQRTAGSPRPTPGWSPSSSPSARSWRCWTPPSSTSRCRTSPAACRSAATKAPGR